MTTMNNNTMNTDRKTSPTKSNTITKSKSNSQRFLKKITNDDPYVIKNTNSKRYQIELSNNHKQSLRNHQPYYNSNYQTFNGINNTNPVLRTTKSAKSIRQPHYQQKTHLNTSKNSFDIKNIRKDNQKEFFNFLSNDVSFSQNTIMESKSNLLIKMIQSIKENCFDKYQKELNDKIIFKGLLEQSINNIKQNIIEAKGEQKCQNRVDSSSNKVIGALITRVREIKPVNQVDYYSLQKEITNIQTQINNNKQQTIEVNTKLMKETNELTTMKESLRRLNKIISDKEKEKENFYPAIQLMKKHIATIKSKIQTQARINNNVTHKMANVIIEKDI